MPNGLTHRKKPSTGNPLRNNLKCRIDLWYVSWYFERMETAKKITILISEELLDKAQEATGLGITPTIRRGLELVAASDVYEKLEKLKGKVKLSIRLKMLREDR